MAEKCCWDSLPSVIVVEILSQLPLNDKFTVSSTCKRWRNCLYEPHLWRAVDFVFSYGSRRKARFLTEKVGRFVKRATVTFNSKFYSDVVDCLRLLQEFARNGNLQKLVLKPISFQVAWPEHEYERCKWTIQEMYLETLDSILKTSRHLKHLSLGCIPELTDHAEETLQLLDQHQSSDLQTLHISSVKEDPESYGLLDLPIAPFSSFSNLHTLSLDFDYLTQDLLLQFTGSRRVPLQKLIVHVHGLEPTHEKITNATWATVTKANPKLELTLSLLHSFEGASRLLDILRPAMPLVHFRSFFCQTLNIAAMDFIARHLSSRLESVHIVDGGTPYLYAIPWDQETDPFVMLAWKCSNLKHFTFIGYMISAEDVVAIARLRGPQLQTLYIPEMCLTDIPFEEPEDVDTHEACLRFASKVSASLGRPWDTVQEDELPAAVLDPMADAETTYLGLLLADQE